ncbi:MAG: DUF1273 family protein [Clostridia bacterium]|nr:DUF1273 family protein [Clostridia bacterium]
MREKTCCFTGHRRVPLEDCKKIKKSLIRNIEKLILNGVIFFGCGGARGFDMLAAESVLLLREKYPYIRLIMVYPCENQTAYWKRSDIERYNIIKKSADKYVYVSDYYYEGCMQKRNRHLIDCSSHCVCYLKYDKSGTSYTVNYAKKSGLNVINIADEIL